ncbi:MAG: ABC transporter substrate-binding protein [Planctomycetota bacterium]
MVARRHALQRGGTLLSLIALLFGAGIGFPAAAGEGAGEDGQLTPQEQRGRAIYRKGDGGSGGEIRLILSSSKLNMGAAAFPCESCHGSDGEGTEEGGLAPPPIRWRALTNAGRSPVTGRARAGYTPEALRRAIRKGLDPSGSPMHPGMPRYIMSDAQLDDLSAYLRVLGRDSDHDPGVEAHAIRLGSALPLSGPRERMGHAIRGILEAFFQEINQGGGIFGRRLELVVEDSGGDCSGVVAATRRLIENQRVFALIGSFEPVGCDGVAELAAATEVPLIGPTAISPNLSVPPNPQVFYLLASHYEQARVLVEFLATEAEPRLTRLAVIHLEESIHNQATDGVRRPAPLLASTIGYEQAYHPGGLDAPAALEAALDAGAEVVFFFGPSADLLAFARHAEQTGAPLWMVSTGSTLGREAFHLPEGISSRSYLSYPSALPDPRELARMLKMAQRAEVPLESVALQGPAVASGRLLVEGLKQCGRRLSRARLLESLESVRGFTTGLAPPLTYGPNRRIGAMGAYVLRIDREKGELVPVSSWITPRQGER